MAKHSDGAPRDENGVVDDRSIGTLVADTTRTISALVSKEIELAKSELKVSITAGGIGIALLAAAGFLFTLFLVLISVTAAYFINWDGDGLGLKWAFLIVSGFWLLLAGLLILVGIKEFKKVRAPKKAIEQGRKIPSAFKRS